MMKLLNKKQKNNGGFSLVELIVVIAIMVVLVAVLAPLFTRYIESSRRSTDVQTAVAIANAAKTAMADQKTVTSGEINSDKIGTGHQLDTISEVPKVSGTTTYAAKGDSFYIVVNGDTVTVGVNDSANPDLSSESGAQTYKDAQKP